MLGAACGVPSAFEAHGTGTALGDPTEVRALAQAVAALLPQSATSAPAPLLNAIKATVGHAEPAAGMVGLHKALAALGRSASTPNPWVSRVNPLVVESFVFQPRGQLVVGVQAATGVAASGDDGGGQSPKGTGRADAAQPRQGALPRVCECRAHRKAALDSAR